MKLIISFSGGNKSINKFTNFLSIIEDHKGEAKGVIMNMSDTKICAIYYYEDEKSETCNYIEFERENNPYFVFTYLLDTRLQTFSKKLFEDFPDVSDNMEQIITFRITIEEFTSMYKCINGNIKNYENFYLKAKTIEDKGKKLNVFYFKAEDESEMLNQCTDFKIKTAKRMYPIKEYEDEVGGSLTIKISMKALKEIAEKWKNKLIYSKKDFSNNFLIRLVIENKEERSPLYVYFYYNKNSWFSLKYFIEFYEIDEYFKFDFGNYYVVKFDQFIRVLSDYDLNNYNCQARLIFVKNEILIACYTCGVTSEEKESKILGYYSGYTISMETPNINDQDRIEEILRRD